MKIQNLRKVYPKFIYQKYHYRILKKKLEILFFFKIEPNIYFQPKVVIENVKESQIKSVGKGVLDNLVFHLGLIELLSYWKATCSPEIEIRAGSLNEEQSLWWKKLISNGLGQFFYENKIDFRKSNFLKITSPKTTLQGSDPCKVYRGQTPVKLKNRVLAPIGGGKDSIVALEILFPFDKGKINCFSLNPTKAIKKIMETARCGNPIIVRRKIDRKLLELNQKGFLNGHTPFSAYLAFLSLFLAIIFGKRYIALSNERSSNEGNLKYLGATINHQYSKSFDFEKKFRYYSRKYLARNVEYFSFLRPLYEIQIAKIFSRYQKYFDVFLSCNESFKTASGTKKPAQKWCGNCPKCLFVFASLSPFVEKEKLIKIFRKNLFEDKKLLPIMQQLIGERGFKPFECIGTTKECLIVFYLSYKKYRGQTPVNLPALLKYFEEKILPCTVPMKTGLVRGLPKYPNLETESKKILNSWNEQNYLPKYFEGILKSALLYRNFNQRLKFLYNKNKEYVDKMEK